ncbi:MAG: hypothetical protein U9N85_10680 [Bacteroidota bacterium]|nr:hypothetical protein [Bacteroidota bacterium]
MHKPHPFHIPVLGIGYSADTPVKVAHYGINSVMSLVDDILLEKLRAMYCRKFEIPYQEISSKIEDFRAKRITSYLNLVNDIVSKKIETLRKDFSNSVAGSEINKYIEMLPERSELRNEFLKLTKTNPNFTKIESKIKQLFQPGSIDVNIMTKLDKENYSGKEKLNRKYNDAHAALRGFAQSNLKSSLVFSAGMNPALYSYLEEFDDFKPNADGEIHKKIIIKVSDYRSALIQGKFLAKKGVWVSEYRIESGLNCGGHAFATEGQLIGPTLEEFKQNKNDLMVSVHEVLTRALESKNLKAPEEPLPLKISAQGGVGTNDEQEFLLNYYNLDSVGWGSPFLLVPEAVNIDNDTLSKLKAAKEKDVYLSNISPLGVLFNNLRGNTKDKEKKQKIYQGNPGSSCPKRYLVSDKKHSERSICTASRQYQQIEINELNQKDISEQNYAKAYNAITEKSCICVGLGTSALLANDLDNKIEGKGVSICPGPNIAYYNKTVSLKEMTGHIYGRTNLSAPDRPNLFIKELNIYIEHLSDKIARTKDAFSKKHKKHLINFEKNLNHGISYYQDLMNEITENFKDSKEEIQAGLNNSRKNLHQLGKRIQQLFEIAQKENVES